MAAVDSTHDNGAGTCCVVDDDVICGDVVDRKEDDVESVHKQIQHTVGVNISLDKQSDCIVFAAIISYLLHGKLPLNKEEARRIFIQS